MGAGRVGRMPAAFALIAALSCALAGCGAPSPQPTPPASTPASDPPPPSESPTEQPEAFRMPTACAQVLPATRMAQLEALGMELLAGPGGKYGDDYLADPTPEQLAGGITCIWGQEDTPENSVIVSVAPLASATRDAVIGDLVEQGLNQRLDGETIIYERVGDEVAAPAVVNLIDDDSWVSVIEGLGGQEFYEEAVEIADEAAAQVGA